MKISIAASVALVLGGSLAHAQEQPKTTGAALRTADYNPVDENGVNMLSGRLTVQSPVISMGSAGEPTQFYLTWLGGLWVANTPHLWIDKDNDWNITVETDGGSYEFHNMKRDEPGDIPFLGRRYVYELKRPGTVGSLACYFIGAITGGDGWITQCLFGGPGGISATFSGNTVSSGSYPTHAEYDNEIYGNAMVWPSSAYHPQRGQVLSKGPAVQRIASDGGVFKTDYPNGIEVYNIGKPYDRVRTFRMSNRGVANTFSDLVVETPNLDGGDYTKSHLRPKSTTQTMRDPQGRVTSYTFNGDGDLTTITSPEGVKIEFTYDSDHRVKTAKKGGSTWEYSYDFDDDSKGAGTTTRKDPAGYYRKVSHSKKPGPVTKVTDEWGKETTYAYDGYERLDLISYPDGSSQDYVYDTLSRVTSVSTAPAPTSVTGFPTDATVTWKAEYPEGTCTNGVSCWYPNKVIDPRDKITEIERNWGTGLPNKITSPADESGKRAVTSYYYSNIGYFPNGQANSTTDRTIPRFAGSCLSVDTFCYGQPGELSTAYIYGNVANSAANNGLPISKLVTERGVGTRVTLLEESYKYDAIGNLLTTEDVARGPDKDAISIYNLAREKIGEIGPDPDGVGTLPPLATRYTYNNDGKPTLVEQGTVANRTPASIDTMTVNRKTVTQYDAYGRQRLTAMADGTGTVEALRETNYDSFGRPYCDTVRMDRGQFATLLANASLPANICAPQLSGPDGPDRITRTTYNRDGKPAAIERAVGVPNLAQQYVAYGFDSYGKTTSVTDANGNRAEYAYDGHKRLKRWYFPSNTPGVASTTDFEEYDYDASGNRTGLTKRDGRRIGFNYDALNRLASKIVPDGPDVYYSYDLRGLQTAARFDSPTGADAVTSRYDGLGRLTSSTTSMDSQTREILYGYNAVGNLARIEHPDHRFFTYEYDEADRLRYIREDGGAAVVTMAWDAQGRLDTETRGAVSTSYAYDGVSRLTKIEDDLAGIEHDNKTTFGTALIKGYNPAGQVVNQTRSNNAYRVDAYMNLARSYEPANGLNQYTVSKTPGYTDTSYQYDRNGNLTGEAGQGYVYDAENRLISTSWNAKFRYDPLGRLYETSLYSDVTRFLYDGDQLSAEYDASGNLLRRYVHGTGDDDPRLWYEGSSLADRRSLQTDHHGSVVSVADAAGKAITINSYDEYGIPAKTNIGRFQYTGQAWLPELGMYHYKARVYSPALGRFLQTDPVGYEDQINLYAYVGNDPINARDPTGKYELLYHGPNKAKLELAVLAAAKANPELMRRYKHMKDSTEIHDVYEADATHPPSNDVRPDDMAGFDISKPTPKQRVLSGKPAGSVTYIALNGITLPNAGVEGQSLTVSAPAQVSHELFSHGYDKDTGTFDAGIDERTAIANSEIQAVRIENIYRSSVGDPIRFRYSGVNVIY